MTVFTREEIEELYKPFPLDAHSVREGNRSKSGKIQWFVYLDRAAVQRRLDELFPGEWGLTVVSEQYSDSFATCTLSMSIRGIERTCNGGQSLKYQSDTMDEDKIKGAWTEAFRRTASVWGIGLYLYAGDAIWTDGYPDKDWDAQRQRQKEAFDKFAKQHAALPGAKAPNPYSAPAQPIAQPGRPATPKAAATPDGELTHDEAFQVVMKHPDVVRTLSNSGERAKRWNAVKPTLPDKVTITTAVNAMLEAA